LSAVLSATVGAQGVVTGITPGGDAMTMILGTTTVMSVAGEIDEEAVRTMESSCAINAELAPGNRVLNLHRTLDRIDNTGKLSEN
jgi:hypothetical protein